MTGYQSVFEVLVSLGLGDEQIVGRTTFSENGDSVRPGQRQVYDAIPEISPEESLPNREALLALEPDFVIETYYGGFDAASGRATVEELADAGAPAYITGGWCDPEGVRTGTIAGMFDDIRNLGEIFGVPDRAAELAAEYQGLLDDVEQRVEGLEPVEVLAYYGGTGPVNAYGGSGIVDEMIELAGGRNVLTERVATSNPEALLVIFGGPGPSAEEKAGTVFALVLDSAAAQDRRFLPVPAVAAHSGSHNILAVREIAAFEDA
ncbi:MAG: ABC transporter substrate-binding protein [Egibacteraceae bacterium]